ncbi:MAG TPA: FG-GAP-like repeat-containing protein [Pyrinomonadaceae bacterium]|nr:FG-GAP-like repeat-containing protein [Pyrinomonadaceae bacterium]
MPRTNQKLNFHIGRTLIGLFTLLLGVTQIVSAQSFAPAVQYPVGTQPFCVAVGDFNGDGKTDAVVGNNSDKTISVLLGNGNGTFNAKVDYTVGASPNAVTVGDFNGDSKTDIASANSFSNLSNVSILFGNGDGSFGAKTDYRLGEFALPNSIAVGDLNGDGKADLATANEGGGASVLLNVGDGTFRAAVNYITGNFTTSVAINDLNGDGKLDLAVTSYGGNNGIVSIFLGNGDGTFPAAVNYAAGPSPFAVISGDFNGDSKPDLITANIQVSSISVLLGNGNGTFNPATNYPTGNTAFGLAANDFDGDGKTDIAVGANGGYLAVLSGNGDGTFKRPTTFEVPAFALAAGDFNKDGKPDLLTVSNSTNGVVNVLLNQTGPHQISGLIVDENNAPLSGVTVRLSGATPVTAITASNGSYAFRDLAAGVNYTVTATKEHYTFSPQSQAFDNLSTNVTANFTGTLLRYSLSGVVRDFNNVPLGGVLMTLGGTVSSTTVTAADGSYSFKALPGGGSYAITPSLDKYTFSPPTQTFNNLSAVRTANFTGSPVTYSISGFISNTTTGFGVQSVIVSLSGTVSAIQISSVGSYSFTGLPAGGTYTVAFTTFKPGELFTRFIVAQPTSRTFTNLNENVTANFSATLLEYSTGFNPGNVLTADFNGDGKLDLVTARGASSGGAVRLGNGDGTFQAPINYGNTSFSYIAVADINRDGKLDIVGGGTGFPSLYVMFGNGDGTFLAPVTNNEMFENASFGLADFNGDGKLDLAVIKYLGRHNIAIMLGNGDGTFQSSNNYPLPPEDYVTPIVTGDFTGDGKPDVVVGTPTGVKMIVNNGDGTFGSIVNYPLTLGQKFIVVGDLNNDGRPDLAVANYSACTVSVLLGTNSGTFGNAIVFAVKNTPSDIKIGDFNGDGKPDLAVTHNFNSVSAFFGNGDGTFQNAVTTTTGSDPSSLAPGDFNSDGKLDLLTTNRGNGTVGVLLNVHTNAAPVSLSGQITTAQGTPVEGVTVTLAGSQTGTTLTDANGNYTFANLPVGGTYSATPSKTFYRFNPRGQTFNDLTSNQRADFTAALAPLSIVGRVTDAEGNGLGGVTVTLSGSQSATATTNATGTYSFFDLAPGGNYVVTPTPLTSSFSPVSRTFNNLASHLVADFRATVRPTIQFNAAGYTVNENAGSALITVTRAGDTFSAVTINYATSDNTASAGSDYTAAAGTLTFNAGETSKTFSVAITDDTVYEGNETVKLSLSDPTGNALLGTQSSSVLTIIENDSSASTLQLNQSSYSIAEGNGSLQVLVNRSGDSSLPVTVNYATSDAANFLQNCNVMNGAATSRCDYVGVLGTLHFAAGETSKTISIPIVDDTYLEGAENFSLSLSHPSGGAMIGTNQTAPIQIIDNDNTGQVNPIDETNFFVRQHYIDFLGREPDPASIGWNNQINNCVPLQPSCDRLSVSQGIYNSPEFKDRGYFIYKFYSVAFGRKPSYDEFVLDRARVSGFQTEAELEQSKLDFIADFMSRPEFAGYAGLTNDQYVLTLFNLAGVTQVTVNGAVMNLAQMQESMRNGKTRARVLREIAESPEVSARFQVESTIVMHYFGYLRRDPDAAYQDWINIYNQTGDSRNVTNGFVNSPEYRNRFGQ